MQMPAQIMGFGVVDIRSIDLGARAGAGSRASLH
jgi:hypothetical protein